MSLLNARLDRWIWALVIAIMSAFTVYEHATNCQAVSLAEQMARHDRLIAGESEFYNPWQYRIFSAFLLEAVVVVVDNIVPGKDPVIPYLLLHFVQIVIIFYLLRSYLRLLNIDNPYIVLGALLLSCYMMANSVFQSDLSFNTYFDVIFYLLAAILILNNRFIWIIPLAFIAVLNRETSGFIPLMLLAFFVTKFSIQEYSRIPRKVFVISATSLALYAVGFILIRSFYGYREPVGIHGMTSVWDYLRFNITFFRMYPELIGTLGILPLIVILKLNHAPRVIINWFWLIVPFWVIIHLTKSTAMETRLFLVPQLLIFIPAFAWLMHNWNQKFSLNSPLENVK